VIKGLLKGLQVAHQDGNSILLERTKAVLGQLAKNQSHVSSSGEMHESKILMTEVMNLLLKQHKDKQLQQAYLDCFIFLTKSFVKANDEKLLKFVKFTYKELLKSFILQKNQVLPQKLFTLAFEAIPSLGWLLAKEMLKFTLDKEQGGSSKSTFQRMQAVDLLSHLIKVSGKEQEDLIAGQMDALTECVVKIVDHAENWQSKKVKKCVQCVGLFTKSAKLIASGHPGKVQENGARILKAIERACERDKGMCNLKSKVKEIKAIVVKG